MTNNHPQILKRCLSLSFSIMLFTFMFSEVIAAPYNAIGVIDAVYVDDRQAVINDRTFNVASYVKIHDGSTYIGVQHLSPGTPIGFKLNNDSSSNAITEIWILNELPSLSDIAREIE